MEKSSLYSLLGNSFCVQPFKCATWMALWCISIACLKDLFIFHSGIIPDVEELGEGASPTWTTQHSGGYRWEQMRSLRCQVNSAVPCHKTLRILSSLFSLKGCTRSGCQLNSKSGKDPHSCCQLVSTHWKQARTRTVAHKHNLWWKRNLLFSGL